MLSRSLQRHNRSLVPTPRILQMAAHLSNSTGSVVANGTSPHPTSSPSSTSAAGVTLSALPKSSTFTSSLPPDPTYATPSISHRAPRSSFRQRMVPGALYTYIRPEESNEPELLCVSPTALRDIGLKEGEESTQDFKSLVGGNKIYWDAETEKGIYPWAQNYGGFQFGQWAGQLGDGRAISLFESTNKDTGTRYEIQLKGAGKTPYSRFADGKAVLRSSIREFIVSEALNALRIPTTRALSISLLPHEQVFRETTEPGAIVCRFAQSWLRIGTFDLLRARGDRDLVRKLADYVAEEVFGGWDKLPGKLPLPSTPPSSPSSSSEPLPVPPRNIAKDAIEGEQGDEENRYARLYREIIRRNATTVAAWQAYAFTNGVLNTDNTSLLGLSLDFGPFAFLDTFDPSYTPNHDDHASRYSYRNQPTIIWWNLVRLGESLGELLGIGERVDEAKFVEKGVTEEYAPILIKRAEGIITRSGEEYKAVFLDEYKRLMTARLGLKTSQPADFEVLFSELLDTMEALELDFHHFFRRLSSVAVSDIDTAEKRIEKASIFLHAEAGGGCGTSSEEDAKKRIGAWLGKWRERIVQDWGEENEGADTEREKAMKSVNPKFIPRSWLLSEVIDRVSNQNDRTILPAVLKMALSPFEETWNLDSELEARFCGEVPVFERAMQCSCSS